MAMLRRLSAASARTTVPRDPRYLCGMAVAAAAKALSQNPPNDFFGP